jgi:hypothetical protein
MEAHRFAKVTSGHRVPSQRVVTLRYLAEMLRIDAGWVPAEMVQHLTRRE